MTTFRFWDDEGYVLISLRNFSAGGSLYLDVFSQYGPFYNLLFAGLHRAFGFPLDPAGARWFVCFAWTATSLGGLLLVARATRSLLWGVTAALAAFVLLRTLTHEPLHPVGLVVLVLVIGSALALRDLESGRDTRALILAAVTGTLLALVKINVGAFYLAGVGVFVLWSSTCLADRMWVRVAVIAAAVTAGFVLLRTLFDQRWVQVFVVVYALSCATTLGVLALELRPRRPLLAGIAPVLLAAISASALVLGLAVVVGVGPAQLLEGMILGPLRHPTAFSFPFRWSGLTLPIIAANLVACASWWFLRHRKPLAAQLIVAGARLIVGAGFLASFFHQFAVSVEGYLLSFAYGFMWALAAPLAQETPGAKNARHLLVALALFQLLHAFPVAGTQIAVGSVLLTLLLLIAFADLVRWFQITVTAQFSRHWASAVAVGMLLLPLWGFARSTVEAGRRYVSQPPETFTGAHLHLSPWQTSTLEVLTTNIRAHSDVLFSLPGMFSFNLWTDRPAPTLANITHWWSLLNPAQQAATAVQLAAASRPLILVQRNLITSGLAKDHFRPSLLTRVIEREFTLRFSLDSYEIWTRRDTPFQSLHLAIHSFTSPDAFEFFSSRPGVSKTDRIEFIRYGRGISVGVASTSTFALTTTSTEKDGAARWHCRLSPPSSVVPDCDAARLLAADGALIAEIRFPRPHPQANPE